MTLLIDIGNSRIKYAWLHEGELQSQQAVAYQGEGLSVWCQENLSELEQPAAVWVANVLGGKVTAELTRWCEFHWQLTPVYAETEAAAGGVRNGYYDPDELGVDRWLAMVGARQRYQGNVCIISAGTALTLDALNAAGEHLGGLILPGPLLMQQALRQATHAVQVESSLPATLQLARGTQDGVANGCGYAIVGLIERQLDMLAETGDSWQALITGGAAAAIKPLCRWPLHPEPRLVLEGLAWYAGQSQS